MIKAFQGQGPYTPASSGSPSLLFYIFKDYKHTAITVNHTCKPDIRIRLSHMYLANQLSVLLTLGMTEYVLQNQAAVRLLLPFSYEDITDLLLREHRLCSVFVAFTHSSSGYWMPDICHTSCRAGEATVLRTLCTQEFRIQWAGL